MDERQALIDYIRENQGKHKMEIVNLEQLSIETLRDFKTYIDKL